MPELFSKGPADSMGKFTIKVKNVNKYKEKEIDIGKVIKTTESLFKSLI